MTKSTKLFFAVIGIFCILQISKLLFPISYLRQFHLNDSSFTKWSFFQTIPSMYNYSNRIWESSYEYDPITVKEILAQELEHEGTQLNHYPVRVFTFRLDRDVIFNSKLKTLYVRSTYRGKVMVSAFEVKINNGMAEIVLKEVHVGE